MRFYIDSSFDEIKFYIQIKYIDFYYFICKDLLNDEFLYLWKYHLRKRLENILIIWIYWNIWIIWYIIWKIWEKRVIFIQNRYKHFIIIEIQIKSLIENYLNEKWFEFLWIIEIKILFIVILIFSNYYFLFFILSLFLMR